MSALDPQPEPLALPPSPLSVDRRSRVASARLRATPIGAEPAFRDYLRVLARHRWVIVACFLVAAAVAAVWAFTTRPVYTASVTLRIAKEEPRVLKFEEVVRPDGYDDYQTQLQTHYNLLRSRKLARRVIAELDLEHHPDFAQSEADVWWQRIQSWVKFYGPDWLPTNVDPDAAAAPEGVLIESPSTRVFERRLTVETVRNARLLKVSFDSHDPELTARVANALADTFILQTLEEKGQATRYASDFLTRQLADARRKLESSDERLNEFLTAHNIIFVGSDPPGNRQDLITQQLTVLSDALLKARSERIGRESLITQALQQDIDSVPIVLQSPLIGKLREELVGLEGEHRKLGLQFRPEYPRLQRLGANIAEVRRQLHTEMGRLVGGLEADFRAALRSEQELRKAVDQQSGVARRLGDQLARYNSLRREVDTSRELFASLLTRLKETQISSSLLTSNIIVADPAEVPASPTRPRRGLVLAVASLVGLLGGVALAFVADWLDTNIKDFRELQATVAVPTLGFVPSRAALEGRRLGRNGDSGQFALVAHTESRSLVAESFRRLRTTLLYSSAERPPRSVLVTSLHPEDGKTSLASNLAITMAQLGNGKILLVDGDLRQPELHTLFKASPSPGLSDAVLAEADPLEVVQQTEIQNLSLLLAGRRAVSPAELLASRRFEEVLAELTRHFAHVVIDAPPLFEVSDAMIVAPRVEGVVLVLRHGRATREATQEAVHLLRSVRANLLGVVLNDVDGRVAGPGYASLVRGDRLCAATGDRKSGEHQSQDRRHIASRAERVRRAHSTTLLWDGPSAGLVIYRISEETAFTTALEAFAALFPKKSVDNIVDGHRGYNADERSWAGDWWHHQLLVIPAVGTDTSGTEVKGYWYDYSGGGTFAPTTKQTTGLLEFVRSRLNAAGTATVVTNLRDGKYETDRRAYFA